VRRPFLHDAQLLGTNKMDFWNTESVYAQNDFLTSLQAPRSVHGIQQAKKLKITLSKCDSKQGVGCGEREARDPFSILQQKIFPKAFTLIREMICLLGK
jgi:hypothetical protein